MNLLIYSILAVVLTLIAGTVPLMKKWNEDHLHGFVSFSGGVLLATAFLHLWPDLAIRPGAGSSGLFILLSFLTLFILEKFIMLHPCEETHCDYHTIGIAAFVGMMIHTFFDGFALGASFKVPGLAGIVFFAIMAHKIPSSFALGSILKKGQWSRVKIIVFILIFGLVIPVGAVTSIKLLDVIGESAIGPALAVSLGIFLYISISDFLPEVHRVEGHRIKNLTLFLTGIALMAGVSLLVPDVH